MYFKVFEGRKCAANRSETGVTEGTQLAANTEKDVSRNFREVREKPICVPEGVSTKAVELVVFFELTKRAKEAKRGAQ